MGREFVHFSVVTIVRLRGGFENNVACLFPLVFFGVTLVVLFLLRFLITCQFAGFDTVVEREHLASSLIRRNGFAAKRLNKH